MYVSVPSTNKVGPRKQHGGRRSLPGAEADTFTYQQSDNITTGKFYCVALTFMHDIQSSYVAMWSVEVIGSFGVYSECSHNLGGSPRRFRQGHLLLCGRYSNNTSSFHSPWRLAFMTGDRECPGFQAASFEGNLHAILNLQTGQLAPYEILEIDGAS